MSREKNTKSLSKGHQKATVEYYTGNVEDKIFSREFVDFLKSVSKTLFLPRSACFGTVENSNTVTKFVYFIRGKLKFVYFIRGKRNVGIVFYSYNSQIAFAFCERNNQSPIN